MWAKGWIFLTLCEISSKHLLKAHMPSSYGGFKNVLTVINMMNCIYCSSKDDSLFFCITQSVQRILPKSLSLALQLQENLYINLGGWKNRAFQRSFLALYSPLLPVSTVQTSTPFPPSLCSFLFWKCSEGKQCKLCGLISSHFLCPWLPRLTTMRPCFPCVLPRNYSPLLQGQSSSFLMGSQLPQWHGLCPLLLCV